MNNSLTVPLNLTIFSCGVGFRTKNVPYFHVKMLYKLCMCWPFKMILLQMYPCAKSAKAEFQTDIYTHTGHMTRRSKNTIFTWSVAYFN